MSHSLNKIWIHAIWSTKDRMPLLHKSIEPNVYRFIAEQFREQGCMVKVINGMPDHIHCLFLLNPQKSMASIIKQVKGSSSHYINENSLAEDKFLWQIGYASYSVSESVLDHVYRYIKNQKAHHQTKTFNQEFEEFLQLYHSDTKPKQ